MTPLEQLTNWALGPSNPGSKDAREIRHLLSVQFMELYSAHAGDGEFSESLKRLRNWLGPTARYLVDTRYKVAGLSDSVRGRGFLVVYLAGQGVEPCEVVEITFEKPVSGAGFSPS